MMKTVGIVSAILINVALFAVYYIGLGQDQPVNPYAASSKSSPNPSHSDSASHLQSSLYSTGSAGAERSDEKGAAGDRFKEVLDGKEVIEHKEVIDPKVVAAVGEFSDSVNTPIQPQLPNTEFRPANRKLGISSAANPANLEPPVISPESR